MNPLILFLLFIIATAVFACIVIGLILFGEQEESSPDKGKSKSASEGEKPPKALKPRGHHWFFTNSGELKVRRLLRRLNSSGYEIFNNVYLQTDHGLTEIDHVVISRSGVFVIETKDYQGMIFGTAGDKQWTQCMGRKKFRFQNPIRQNYRHIREVEKQLGLNQHEAISVVVFVGSARMMTDVPDSVIYARDLLLYIKSFKNEVYGEERFQKMVSELDNSRLSPVFQTKRKHITSLNQRFDKVDSSKKVSSEPVHSQDVHCPRCGGKMVLRKARKGPDSGQQFWGCSGFPKCRGIRSLRQDPDSR